MNNLDGADTFKIDFSKNMNSNFIINNGILEENENEIEIPYDNLDSNSSLINDKENENKNLEKEMKYVNYCLYQDLQCLIKLY